MPHLTIEYSANLEVDVDLSALCERLRDVLLASGLFELGAIRVRAIRADHYAIADNLPENAFADLRLRLGQGRLEVEREALGVRVMQAASTHFAAQLAKPHFALSLEIVEIDSRFSWKTNAIHPRLRGAGGK
ncbi:MAG: 5-carboxymethyl-2-hydroxymuconate Delta-isomerase [Rhodobacteraceae bacterium]|nr:5-carboxymethyl-2-hydroxymuconate Delta-isomerase [Paracoccaceae bacterium]